MKPAAMFRRAASLLVCSLALFCFALPRARADGQTLQTIRVGFFAFDGYHMVDPAGERSGYGYDLLQHMAGYTDWTFSYVGYDKSWNEMQDMLENGEIDLLTSAQKTEARMRRFDFSDAPIGTSSAILTVKAGDETYALSDQSNWSGIRIGMIEGNSRNDNLADYAAEHGFTYEPVYFADTDEMVAALKAGGRIDAILTSNLRAIDSEWIIAEFSPSPFYVMVRKGNDALLSEVNDALSQLFVDEPELRTQLMNQYYTPDNGDEIAFTHAERDFIRQSQQQPLTAIINPDRTPFSCYRDGQPAGIIGDFAREVLNRCGLNVVFLEPATRAEYRRMAENGEADIRFDAWYQFADAEKTGYRLTSPYLDVSVSRLYNRNNKRFSSAALLRGSDLASKYARVLSGQYDSIAYYDSIEELALAVRDKKQDVGYLYRRSAELAVQNDVTNRLVAEETYGFESAFAVGVNQKQSHTLFSILNKTVMSIGPDQVEDIVRRHTSYDDKPFSLIGYAYDYPIHIILFVGALFLFALLAFGLYTQSRRRKRERVQLADEKRQNELLASALAAAEKADAAKSQFLSRVSHEMRTPLNAIIGFLTLAQDSDGTKTAEYLAHSETAARQLLSVINDVLDMSSIESGKLKIASSPFDFRHMIHSITSMFVTQCLQKGLAFETKLLTPVDEWLVGDQLRVNQILMNLLGNALKFTSAGQIQLRVRQTDTQDGRVFIRFEVSDTGCGMSAEMQSRLFRPFEQESAATAQKYGGNGLGLSIVKNLVSLMSGAIRVESTPGEGSTFIVDLPFARWETQTDRRVPEGVNELHVLVVDDEQSERDYISAVLERTGIRHVCVPNADRALSELIRADQANDPYNFCLVDWRMPDVDGIETTRRIRERFGSDIIVVVASAYEQEQANLRAKNAGASAFLTKPFFQSSLLDLFMTLTGGRLAKPSVARAAGDFNGKRVLLAEDNAMNRMVAVGLIRKFGIECDTAEDGQIAVTRFLTSPSGYYDAILMDIQMPNMDGFEATRHIRTSAHPDAKSVPIIALTANAFSEDVAKTLSSGMNAHVAKPIEPDVLQATLAGLLLGADAPGTAAP